MIFLEDPDGVIKAITAEVNLGRVKLDVYLLPNNEKRMGIEKTSLALGYSERWFYNRTKRQSKWLKGLLATGFTGAQEEVRVIRKNSKGDYVRGSSLSNTISLRDFTKLITYEAIYEKNINAIILLAAFAETGLEKIVNDVLEGRSIDFILEKIVHYGKWTYKELEEVLEYNRNEVRQLHSWVMWNDYDIQPV